MSLAKAAVGALLPMGSGTILLDPLWEGAIQDGGMS